MLTLANNPYPQCLPLKHFTDNEAIHRNRNIEAITISIIIDKLPKMSSFFLFHSKPCTCNNAWATYKVA